MGIMLPDFSAYAPYLAGGDENERLLNLQGKMIITNGYPENNEYYNPISQISFPPFQGAAGMIAQKEYLALMQSYHALSRNVVFS